MSRHPPGNKNSFRLCSFLLFCWSIRSCIPPPMSSLTKLRRSSQVAKNKKKGNIRMYMYLSFFFPFSYSLVRLLFYLNSWERGLHFLNGHAARDSEVQLLPVCHFFSYLLFSFPWTTHYPTSPTDCPPPSWFRLFLASSSTLPVLSYCVRGRSPFMHSWHFEFAFVKREGWNEKAKKGTKERVWKNTEVVSFFIEDRHLSSFSLKFADLI